MKSTNRETAAAANLPSQTAAEAVLMCTKCADEPRVDQSPDATNRHCGKCRYEYQREWTAKVEQQKKSQTAARAVVTFREALAGSFDRYTIQRFSGPEIASIIRRAQWPAEPEPSPQQPAA